jgi:glycosyltransferase involved in cell wall biosynthesis
MKILFVVREPWYNEIVRELRKNNEVDYIFKSSDKFKIENGNYHISKLLGLRRGYSIVAYLLTTYLLLTKNYDVCVTDYRSVYMPTLFPILRSFTHLFKTIFVYDLRTIPVDYTREQAETIEKQFCKEVYFANRYYQGITVITPEMIKYIQNKCTEIRKEVGIWESGVDAEMFRPLPKNLELKQKTGFNVHDFVCFYHGSLSNARGVIELVESFRIIRHREQAIKLLILGRGECSEKLEEIIRDANLEDTVKIHDWVACNEVPQFISTADLCVIPLPDIFWWRVSSPLKLMEYIACGKNILLTDIIAHTDALGTNNNYFWVHETTAHSFAERIIECYKCYKENPDIYFKRGMDERQRHIDHITWGHRSISLQEYLVRLVKSDSTLLSGERAGGGK